YSTSLTYAALLAAAGLAEAAQDADNAVKWRAVAGDIAVAAKRYLFNDERKAFRKGILVQPDGQIQYNDTIDSSSFFGAFMYGLFPLDSDEVKSAITSLETAFGVNKESPGAPRYENDYYYRKDPG